MAQNSSLSTYIPKIGSSKSRFYGFLDVDRIKSNPLYKCTISGGRTINGLLSEIVGIYNPDSTFGIGINSEYTDSIELPDSLMDLGSQLAGGLGANVLNRSQFILKSLRMSEQRWNGSSAPEFNLNIDIPIVRKNEASWEIVKYMIQATSGSMQDYNSKGQVVSADSAWQIFAPNGYHVQYASKKGENDTPVGTYTISLGEGNTCWFEMHNAIITSMNCNISGKKYYDGNPVSIAVSVGFKFWRYPTYEDCIQWFKKMNRGL